jgi:hypothetical protein
LNASILFFIQVVATISFTRDNENPGDQEIGIGTNNNGTLLKQNAMTRYLSRPANEIENNITFDAFNRRSFPSSCF